MSAERWVARGPHALTDGAFGVTLVCTASDEHRAAQIAREHNAHATLVEALRACVEALGHRGANVENNPAIDEWEQARAALGEVGRE